MLLEIIVREGNTGDDASDSNRSAGNEVLSAVGTSESADVAENGTEAGTIAKSFANSSLSRYH